jgi:phospholipid/cholesterol/gamma-HCH transport system substrate-binding protein
MKISKPPVTRTGFFVVIAFGVLITLLFVIGDKQKLFSNTFKYYIKFKDVSGLKSGAQVLISGINVGSVGSVDLPIKAGDSVLLTVNIAHDALDLLHTDSRAKLVTEGLVGNKAVSITVGGASTAKLPPESYLLGESPIELGAIMDSATAIVTTTKELMTNINTLIGNLNSGKGTLGSLLTKDELYKELTTTIHSTNTLMGSIASTAETTNGALDTISNQVKTTVAELNNILRKIRDGNGTLPKLLNDSSLYVTLATSMKSIESSMTGINDMVGKLSKSAGNAEEVTEALKHNFLVKGYFEDRGYWDAANYEASIQNKLDSLKTIENHLKTMIRK